MLFCTVSAGWCGSRPLEPDAKPGSWTGTRTASNRRLDETNGYGCTIRHGYLEAIRRRRDILESFEVRIREKGRAEGGSTQTRPSKGGIETRHEDVTAGRLEVQTGNQGTMSVPLVRGFCIRWWDWEVILPCSSKMSMHSTNRRHCPKLDVASRSHRVK
jgi:hypothetical protein